MFSFHVLNEPKHRQYEVHSIQNACLANPNRSISPSYYSENITLKRAAVLESAPQGAADVEFFSVYVHGKVANAAIDSNVQVMALYIRVFISFMAQLGGVSVDFECLMAFIELFHRFYGYLCV